MTSIMEEQEVNQALIAVVWKALFKSYHMDTQEVHCLKCDDIYTETDTFIEVCPFCGNDDTQATVYLQKE